MKGWVPALVASSLLLCPVVSSSATVSVTQHVDQLPQLGYPDAIPGGEPPVLLVFSFGGPLANIVGVEFGFDPCNLANCVNSLTTNEAVIFLLAGDGQRILQNDGDGNTITEALTLSSAALSELNVDGITSLYIGILNGTVDSADVTLTVTTAPVPLPAAAWMLLSGLAGLGAMTRCKPH